MMPTTALTPDQINRVVAFWRRVLGGTAKQDALGSQRDSPMEMAMLIRTLTAVKSPTTDAALDTFEAHLRAYLAGSPDWILSVDYGPDIALADAAEAAGIDSSRFPVKTTMFLDRGDVRVSYGYGAPIQRVRGDGTLE